VSKSNARTLFLLLLVVVLATSCVYFLDRSNSGTQSSAASAETSLDRLKVSEPGTMSGYSREKFPNWSKASEFGWDPPESSCNTREAALIRDGEAVVVGRECKVESGTRLDPLRTRRTGSRRT